MKKLLTLLAVLLLFVTVASAETVTEGDWEFKILKDGTKELVKYYGKDENVTIPDGVTSIGRLAFYDCSNLNCVIIPDSVTSIGKSAFYKCLNLRSVTIPNSVTSIGSYAFFVCTSLSSVEIPNSVMSIGDGAFSNCDSVVIAVSRSSYAEQYCKYNNLNYIYADSLFPKTLTDGNWKYRIQADGTKELVKYHGKNVNVTIPDGVTSIGDNAFYNCSDLASITIPNSVESIGSFVFSGCSSLSSIMIPNSVVSIGNYAFSRCSSLSSITIPDSVTSIGNGAFLNCGRVIITVSRNSYAEQYCRDSRLNYVYADSLSTQTFTNGDWEYRIQPDGTKELIKYHGNGGSLIIPQDVTSIGNEAFSWCDQLTGITIPNSVTGIGDYAFAWCMALRKVVIPKSVTSIPDFAFYSCHSLSGITIPESVTEIGYSAFSSCNSLTEVVIPDGVTGIDGYAFSDCVNLRSVTIPASVTGIGENAFSGCGNAAFTVARDSYAARYCAENGLKFTYAGSVG